MVCGEIVATVRDSRRDGEGRSRKANRLRVQHKALPLGASGEVGGRQPVGVRPTRSFWMGSMFGFMPILAFEAYVGLVESDS